MSFGGWKICIHIYIYMYIHTHVIKDCFRLPIFLEIKMHSLLNMF